MPRFAWSHHWRARPTPAGRSFLVYRWSSGTHHHTRLLKQKGKCVFVKRNKGRPAQSYLNGGEDDELVIVVGPPLRHLRHRDDAKVLAIVVVDRVQHGEYRGLLAKLPDEVYPGLISEVVHLAIAPPNALLLCIHHVRGYSHNVGNGRRPSAQEFMVSQ
jgi:hypothetical protein